MLFLRLKLYSNSKKMQIKVKSDKIKKIKISHKLTFKK